MVRRLSIAGIVLFWILMNTALVRVWLYPETSEILTLPPVHVLKEVFLHEQTSSLAIYQDGKAVGGITLRPRRDDPNGLRIVEFTGKVLLKLPFLDQQPFSWYGSAEMNRAFALRELKLHIDTHPQTPASKPRPTAATSDAVDLEVEPLRNRANYRVSHGQKTITESTLTLDEKGARSALQILGADPSVLNQLTAGTMGMVDQFTVTARQSEVRIEGERLDVFHVAMSQGPSPMIEIDVSQLGQVLFIKTAFGFNFSPATN